MRIGKHVIPQALVEEAVKRIKANIEEVEGPEGFTNCWEWRGFVNECGYGRLAIRRRAQGFLKSPYVHRVMYVHYKGEVPRGMEVMHMCHNCLCVNPDHLQAGTHAENMKDMIERTKDVPF